jgi:2-aminobenzoate-CoA ligase
MLRTAHVDRYVLDRLPAKSAWPELVYPSAEFVFPDQANAVEHLLDHAVTHSGHAQRALLRSSKIGFTYAEVQARVNRIAQVLVEDHGLVPGNRVLLRGTNSIGMALSLLAVLKAGLIAVATMPMLRARELTDIVEKAQPQLAICDAQLTAELEAVANPSFTKIIRFNAPDDPQDLGALAAAKSGVFQACKTSADDPALLAFTSGTTGKPKAAVHTHRDLLAACAAWPKHVLRLSPDDICLGSPPLAFTFGLGGLLLFPMAAGASVYFHDGPYTPESMVRTIAATGATVSYTAPTFYRQMAQHARALGVARLRICVSAGEGLPDATRQEWKAASGIEMLDGIGATEMFHIFISSAGSEVRAGAIGKVVPGYEAKVVDDAGQELPRGTVGKLAVRGCTGCKYLDDARQSVYVKDGWNYPGDAFIHDADGYFIYQARADDMIVSAGYNIAGPEVESALLLHPAVAECGVIGKADEERGMRVSAFVVLKPDVEASEATKQLLQDHVKQTLAPYKYPREVNFVPQLPRTETGKLQRFRLREL